MADLLVVVEQRDGAVKRVSHEALGAARAVASGFGGAVHALVIGPPGTPADELGRHGADRVFAARHEAAALYQPELYATIAVERIRAGGYEAVFLPATALGKDLGPRLAARLECPLATDVTEVSYDGGLVVRRPAYSGKAVYRLRLSAQPAVVSLRPNAFAPREGSGSAPVEEIAVEPKPAKTRTREIRHPERAALDVAEASVVVSGGRGLKGPENFKLIEELAQVLGAAVGASRAVVDAGWRPHAEQVGQTGKTVSPNLYVAVGISGAVQHLAGMRTAKVIVAINKDREAPIFKVADYGIVGDLFEVVPRLTAELKKLKAQ